MLVAWNLALQYVWASIVTSSCCVTHVYSCYAVVMLCRDFIASVVHVTQCYFVFPPQAMVFLVQVGDYVFKNFEQRWSNAPPTARAGGIGTA